jgi:predicted MFS family arabinose efflux permease
MSVTTSEKTTSRGEWAASWPVPVVSAVGMGVSLLPLYSLGALIPSIQHATHWTRAQISFGPTLLSIGAVLLAPMVGRAIDRFGSRRVALPGLALFCLAVAGVSLSSGDVASWWLAWAVMAVADVAIKTTVWTTAVVSLFERTRGLAIGVALSGTGIASTCLPYLATVLQEAVGWRGTYAVLAAGAAALSLPLVGLWFYDAGDQRRRNADRRERAEVSGMSLGAALRSRRFLQLALVCLLSSTCSIGLIVHYVPILKDNGMTPRLAAEVAGVIGISTMVGRLAGGWLLDRFSARLIGFAACALSAVACPILMAGHSLVGAIAAAALIGGSGGSEIGVIAYLVPRHFGLRHFGTLFSVMSALLTVGAGLGPWLAGYSFDRFGNYHQALLIAGPLFAICAVLLATLGAPSPAAEPTLKAAIP